MSSISAVGKKANGHRRFLAEDVMKQNTRHEKLTLEESDAEAGAMQLTNVRAEQELEWEGFNEEPDAEESGHEENVEEPDEVSDNSSVEIHIEEKLEKLIAPKDAEEEELERLIFGDAAGFRKRLEDFSLDRTWRGYVSDESEEQDGAGFDNVADQDLFFFDSGPAAAPAGPLPTKKVQESEDMDNKPAWEDSDDERLVVSLTSAPQLRKLRETADDDIVDGKEYARRLRQQYERLYPRPAWAIEAIGQINKKRSRNMDEDGSDDSASDMDVDDVDLSTQPLSKLLKDADIFSRSAKGVAKKRKLQAGTIDIQRLKDVAKAGPSAITSLSFHPTYPLLLSSGPSSTLYLHHVNPNPPNPNPLLTSLHVKRTPLTTTAFHPSPSDSRIFLSARRRYFHVWNIATGQIEKVSRVYGHQHEQRSMEHFSLSPNGKYMALRGSSKKGGGVINILDAYTMQWATQARVESRGGIADFAWWGDSNGLSIAGKNGEVTEWSVEQSVIGRWNDEGAVGTTTIALGGKSGRDAWIGGDRWVAVGSSSGVVNIYDRRAWNENDTAGNDTHSLTNGGLPRAPRPVRALQNLTTPISHLTFSFDGQILAMASRWKGNALRLVHLPSASVFKNWPTTKTPLGRITAVAWGRPAEEEEREGSYALLAVANEAGHVRLWEVRV